MSGAIRVSRTNRDTTGVAAVLIRVVNAVFYVALNTLYVL